MTTTSVETPQRARSNDERKPSTRWRAPLVTFAPALLFDAMLASSVTATTFASLLPARRRRRSQIARAFAAAGDIAAWGYLLALRPWMRNWGATDDEVRRVLPGDEFIHAPVHATTRAVTIDAPPERVWPWLVQMGQNRGGLYSYDWLENLAGLDIHSADRIVPEWQVLEPGDVFRLAPGEDTMLVQDIVPNRAIVLRLANPTTGEPMEVRPGSSARAAAITWAFVLEPIDDRRTRLLVRWRIDCQPRWWMQFGYPLSVELPHFIMERKMLLGIKQRAEDER